MHPHLSAIGFVTQQLSEIPALADLAAQAATPIETRRGLCYLHWAGKSGAELWLQLSRDSKLVGLMPHFAGPARMRVALTERVDREDATELDQAYYAWAEPEPGEAHRTFPFVFDCPNPLVHTDLPCPTVATLQVAAFPLDLTLYPTLAQYEAEHGERAFDAFDDLDDLDTLDDEPPAARGPTFLHSIGLDVGDGTSLRTAEALSMITGVVKQTATYQNELTAEPFHWALLECMRAEIDLVIDPRMVAEPPRVGGIATGIVSLSGRFVDYQKQRGFFDRARGVT